MKSFRDPEVARLSNQLHETLDRIGRRCRAVEYQPAEYNPRIAMNVSSSLERKIAEFQRREGIHSRAEAVRQLICKGLEAA